MQSGHVLVLIAAHSRILVSKSSIIKVSAQSYKMAYKQQVTLTSHDEKTEND